MGINDLDTVLQRLDQEIKLRKRMFREIHYAYRNLRDRTRAALRRHEKIGTKEVEAHIRLLKSMRRYVERIHDAGKGGAVPVRVRLRSSAESRIILESQAATPVLAKKGR